MPYKDTAKEISFNKKVGKARVCIENRPTFGIFKHKFRTLKLIECDIVFVPTLIN